MARQRPEPEVASPIPAGIIVTLVRHHFRNRFSDSTRFPGRPIITQQASPNFLQTGIPNGATGHQWLWLRGRVVVILLSTYL